MERLFETAVRLAEQGRTMRGGIPRPLDLALFMREFENEVEAAVPPRWMQRLALAPLAWLARSDAFVASGARARRRHRGPQPFGYPHLDWAGDPVGDTG